MRITYNAEYPQRIRAGFIGCGGHAYRNIFPTFQYAPVDLIAVCDVDGERANHFARTFGAQQSYIDYRDMLEKESLDAVFVVTDYDEAGKTRYPGITADILRAGSHAWIEKPPAASSDEVRDMMAVSEETGRFIAVGFKKMFFPAMVKAKSIVESPDFGGITSITARYPEHLPPFEDRRNPIKMVGFLDHIVHPHSVLRYFAGPLENLIVQRHANGGCCVLFRFKNGAVGSLHLAHGQSPVSFLERTEIVGWGHNVIVDNNIRVTHYRPGGAEGGYGRAGDAYVADDQAALTWEPEFSLGQLYNKGLFLLGYAPEIIYFCECVLDNRPPEKGNLDDALELLQIYEAYLHRESELVTIGA